MSPRTTSTDPEHAELASDLKALGINLRDLQIWSWPLRMPRGGWLGLPRQASLRYCAGQAGMTCSSGPRSQIGSNRSPAMNPRPQGLA